MDNTMVVALLEVETRWMRKATAETMDRCTSISRVLAAGVVAVASTLVTSRTSTGSAKLPIVTTVH